MTFEKKLKAVSSKVKPGTIRIYLQNIKRLYRLGGGEDELPGTGKWLMKSALWEKMMKKPVNIRRHLSLAGLKTAYAYKLSKSETKKWYDQMMKDSSHYHEDRGKNKASDKEKKLLAVGNIKALKKSAVELKKRLRFVLGAEPNLKGLYSYEWFIATKLYTEIPFRNDFATVRIGNSDKGNVLVTGKGNFKFIMRDYKNSDRLGERVVPLSRANTMAVRKFLTYRKKVPMKHDYLFTSYKGAPMTKASFGKALQKTYERLLGARLGSRIIRIIHANSKKAALAEVQELSNKMLHSAKQTAQYVKQ